MKNETMKVKRFKKILLIQAPLDNNNPAVNPASPPLVVLSLANYLKEKSLDLEIKIMDGQLFGLTLLWPLGRQRSADALNF